MTRGVTRLDGARGKKQVWRLHIRTWGLSEANVLYWRKCLWHYLGFSATNTSVMPTSWHTLAKTVPERCRRSIGEKRGWSLVVQHLKVVGCCPGGQVLRVRRCCAWGRSEVRLCPGQETCLDLPCSTWRLSEANVLHWRKYLWHSWDFSPPFAVIRR